MRSSNTSSQVMRPIKEPPINGFPSAHRCFTSSGKRDTSATCDRPSCRPHHISAWDNDSALDDNSVTQRPLCALTRCSNVDP
eukprot:7874115-Pyramimonas_sp.AAC.1